MNDKLEKVDVKELEGLLGGDLDLVLFFVSWVKHNRNSTNAYLELHPKVLRTSAQSLGSLLLAKIDPNIIMKYYDLGEEEYFQQLRDGMKSDKWNDFTGEREPDHKTRRVYHEVLGKILGIERPINQTNIQINIKPILYSQEHAE